MDEQKNDYEALLQSKCHEKNILQMNLLKI